MISTLQGLRLRECEGVLTQNNYSSDLGLFIDEIGTSIPLILEDQPLDAVLRDLVDKIQNRTWLLYGGKQ